VSVLDLDYYKLTMLQFIWKHYADVPVTFRLHSRKQNLDNVVTSPGALAEAINRYSNQELTDHEADYLLNLGLFEQAFIDDLVRLFGNRELAPLEMWRGGVKPQAHGSLPVCGKL